MATKKNIAAAAVADESLAEVTGGYDKYHDEASNRYYVWSGKLNCSDKYLCPNCGRPVTPGFLNITFKCRPCDASWVFESPLRPNLSAGGWKEVSEEDYNGSGANPLIR